MIIGDQRQTISSSTRTRNVYNADLESTKGQNYTRNLISDMAKSEIYDTAITFYNEGEFILIATSPGPIPRFIISYYPEIQGSQRSISLASELNYLFEECSQANWDGFGARRVNRSLRKKTEMFLDALPTAIPDPEICADPDGEISLDWCFDKDKYFSISIGRSELTYAGIDGERRFRGIEIFENEIPEFFIVQLNNFLSDII